jgi:N-[(2S)-2-amino-2-carboxyethyl]-L-glutamate dehydrogenase
MSAHEVLFLSQEDVIAAGGLDMPCCIEAVEEAMVCHSRGDAVMPSKTVLRRGDERSESTEGRINAMPAYLGGNVDMAGIKWLGSNPTNPQKYGLPRATGILILNDPDSKFPLAIMDSAVISAMRTGAAGGIGVKYLSRSDSRVMGIIGAGVQARTQAMAAAVVRPGLEKILIYDINRERAESWRQEMSESLRIPCKAVRSAEEAVRDADFFVTVTTAHEPIVKAAWIRGGQTFIHMAGYEDELAVVQRADKIVVDSWVEIKHRALQTLYLAYEKGLIREEDIHAEIGEIILGSQKGREDDNEFIYYNTVGMGIEDIAFGARIYREAKGKNMGTRLSLWREPLWV